MMNILQNKKLNQPFMFIFLLAISFLYFWYGCQYFDFRTYHFDEGMSVYGATQVLNGALPCRDFWTYHMPGRFYVLAAIFKIFGISLKTAVLSAVFILSLTSSAIYLFVSRVNSRIFAIFAYLLSMVLFKSYMVYNRTAQYAILFYIFSFFPLLSYLSSGKRKWLFIGGLFAGMIGLFRIDFEFFCLASFFIVVLLKRITQLREGPYREMLISIMKDCFYLFGGFLLVFLPVFIFFIRYGGSMELQGYVLSGVWLKNRFLPFPGFKAGSFIFYLPALVFLITVFKLVFFEAINKDRIFWLKVFLLLSLFFLYGYTVSRPDMPHLLATMVPVIILFILFYGDFMKSIAKFKYGALYKGLLWGVSFSACFLLIFLNLRHNFINSREQGQHRREAGPLVPRAEGIYDFSEYAQSQMEAIRYIRERTGMNEKIFVGNLRHDRLVNNDVMFYFLAERQSATRYFVFEPGFTNTRRIQQEIIGDLYREKPRYVVLWTASEEINEPNESSKASGVKDLDEFIQKNYEIERVFTGYIILKRFSSGGNI